VRIQYVYFYAVVSKRRLYSDRRHPVEFLDRPPLNDSLDEAAIKPPGNCAAAPDARKESYSYSFNRIFYC